jgi:hypothetical protein
MARGKILTESLVTHVLASIVGSYSHRWAQSAMDRWIDTDTIDQYSW